MGWAGDGGEAMKKGAQTVGQERELVPLSLLLLLPRLTAARTTQGTVVQVPTHERSGPHLSAAEQERHLGRALRRGKRTKFGASQVFGVRRRVASHDPGLSGGGCAREERSQHEGGLQALFGLGGVST